MDDFDRIYLGKVEDFSGNEFMLMLRLANWFDNPRTPKSFKSKENICKVFENSLNPSQMIRRVVGKMVDRRFIKINGENKLFFDEKFFDEWLEGDSSFGKEIWIFYERHVFPYVRRK